MVWVVHFLDITFVVPKRITPSVLNNVLEQLPAIYPTFAWGQQFPILCAPRVTVELRYQIPPQPIITDVQPQLVKKILRVENVTKVTPFSRVVTHGFCRIAPFLTNP